VARRILHVLAPASYGGLERVVECLALGQRARGHDVHVAALVDPKVAEPPLLPALREGGVQVVSLALASRAYAGALQQLLGTCRALGPYVLHSHGYVTDVLAAVGKGRIAAPVVSSVHGFTGGDWKNRLYEWMQCRAYRRFEGVLAVSEKLAHDLVDRGVPARRLHVVPNAFPGMVAAHTKDGARRALGIPTDAFCIGWVGRVSREKGLDVLIDALPDLAGLPWQLTVVGDGLERDRLEKQAEESGFGPRVSWRGAVPQAYDLIPAFDVLVLSSRTEGTPMVLLEAMSLSVPVVATAVGGIPGVVSPAEALLVAPEDPAALATAIRSIHDHQTEARERALRARVRLETKFAMAGWLDRHDEVYDAVQPPVKRFTV
jgi:glycosyltransferase involved in cell wall biosynthesis